jgi:branched-chain amino acid aminotransferase
MSLRAKTRAVDAGCDDALFLDGRDGRHLEELSGMNIFVVEGPATSGRTTLLTPPAGETVLKGITRASLIELAGDFGFGVREAPIALDDWRAGGLSGRYTEAFACGTAAVIAPIGRVRQGEQEWTIGDGSAGAVTMRLRTALIAIQEGRSPDHRGWHHPVGL